MSIPFVKMHGLGNDFVLIDDLGKPAGPLCQPVTPEARAHRICDRSALGVGADQLLWLKTPLDPRSDARMEILNSDGSVAEMCGNGIRAVALYLYRHGPKRKPACLRGSRHFGGPGQACRDASSGQVRVNMGRRRILTERLQVLRAGNRSRSRAIELRDARF